MLSLCVVSTVESYKYLGMFIDCKLNWNPHVDVLYKKINQRLYFLRKLKSFNVNTEICLLFYKATIQSLITFGISCWGSSLLVKDRERINRLIRKSEKIISKNLPSFDSLYKENATKKAESILLDRTHPLNKDFITSTRSGRILQPKAKTERYKKSFVPASSTLLRKRYRSYSL